MNRKIETHSLDAARRRELTYRKACTPRLSAADRRHSGGVLILSVYDGTAG